jgi:thioredoxin reductase (NADPH)
VESKFIKNRAHNPNIISIVYDIIWHMENYDCVIIGTGAAGLSAGIYAGRYKMSTLIIGKEFGGQTSSAGIIENYPGFKEIDGYELMGKMKEQAEDVGAKIIDGEVSKIEKDGNCFNIFVGDSVYHAHSVVLALGSERRKLGLPNEEELTGRGVHYCITCDGPVYGGKTIAVVGGGDAAVKGISLAAEYADKIYIIVRGDKLRAEPVNKEKLDKLGDKVEIIFNTQVKEIVGTDKLEKIVLDKEYNGSSDLVIDGMFIEIGAIPNTSPVKSLNLKLDSDGHIDVNSSMSTSIPGIYAAGDIMNLFEHFKQDITAAATGAMAATSAYDYYKEHGDNDCDHS